jgi:oligopeptide/dipeptide ABC transporter ATP-binding protein
MDQPILSIQQATKIYGGGFLSSARPFAALDHYSLDIFEDHAKIITVAGESGSGKTTLANLILGFTSCTEGKILYRGTDLTQMTREQRVMYRKEVQAIFQDPYEVYNPFYRVSHIMNMVARHFNLRQDGQMVEEMIEEALNIVGLRGEEILEKYPHQLSGGQRQRVMVARAYMLHPRLIVADEPVSAVDASLRAMILDIMLRLRDQRKISFLYITHDLSTAYQISDLMYVLFQGTTVERGITSKIIEDPKHPYVQELIESIPVPDPRVKWDTNISLPPEEVMRMTNSVGCRFYPRCSKHMDICKTAFPEMLKVEEDHEVACYLYQ